MAHRKDLFDFIILFVYLFIFIYDQYLETLYSIKGVDRFMLRHKGIYVDHKEAVVNYLFLVK